MVGGEAGSVDAGIEKLGAKSSVDSPFNWNDNLYMGAGGFALVPGALGTAFDGQAAAVCQ
jgi:hypothetical protein